MIRDTTFQPHFCYNHLITKIAVSDKIYISESQIPNAGRGVFAKVAIKKNEVIERCPFIEIPESDSSTLSESILVTYFYFFGSKKERIVVVLGYGSLYNHSYTPNTKYKEQYKQKTVDFIALRDIKKNEEIVVNYVQGSKKYKNSLWFDVH